MSDAIAAMLAAELQPHFGTPVDLVTLPTAQSVSLLGNGIAVYAGLNPTVARAVAQATGDAITWPFGTVGFMGGLDEVACFVVHGILPERAGNRVELSGLVDGLPLSRPMLRYLVGFLFDDVVATEVLMRIPPGGDAFGRTL